MSKSSTGLNLPEIPDNFPKYARLLLKGLGAVVKAKAHRDVRKRHERNLAQLEKTLKTLRETRAKAEKASMPKAVMIFNAAQFALIVQYDISALAHDALLSPDGWRRKLYCRFLALTLTEAVEDLSEILGWKFRQAVHGVFIDPELDKRTQALTKAMGTFTASYNKLLRELRHNVAAHRDHDASAQLRMIESVDCAQILDVTCEFVEQNRLICDLLLELVTTAQSKFLYLKMFEPR
jgi:hypothetical protein